MPTKVVLRPSTPPPPPTVTTQQQQEIDEQHDGSDSFQTDGSTQQPRVRNAKTPIKGVVGFRSSIQQKKKKKARPLHLSRMDLRASPRLQGYLYMLVASIVMLVSTVRFYIDRDDDNIEQIRFRRSLQTTNTTNSTTTGTTNETDATDTPEVDEEEYTESSGNVVLTWKLYGAIVVSALGVAISLFVLLVHFDSVCYPHVWKAFFRDGSKAELYFLLVLFLFWSASLHICTSSFSVGVVAPNVFFTTWIAFASVPLNVGVWRKSAEQVSISDWLWSHPRETMHNWFFVFCFSTITSLAIADLYANRNEVEFLLDGELGDIPQHLWNRGLVITFTGAALAFITMVFDHYVTGHYQTKICGCKINLDWRQVEGLIALYLVGVSYWIIVDYTGVNFPLNGPSNAYFGAWGVFFSSIFTFGTWLRENKNIEVIVREPEEEEQESSRTSEQAPPSDSGGGGNLWKRSVGFFFNN